jgi:hypothetical protein
MHKENWKFKIGDVAIDRHRGIKYEILAILEEEYRVNVISSDEKWTALGENRFRFDSCIADDIDPSHLATKQFDSDIEELLK